MRIIQEFVPGKQITIAHIIANPDVKLYSHAGLNPEESASGTAIGIVTMTPAETAIIAGDIAVKSAGVNLGFLDRVAGTLIVSGSVSKVETALNSIVEYAGTRLGFTICGITKS
jgi:ethanolamine utilization protein EutS